MRFLRLIPLLLAFYSAPTLAGTTITFSPGPDGTTSIHTPWGVYVAEELPDGVWVGTEKEYVDSIARGVASRHGDIQVRLPGDKPGSVNFVHKGLSTSVAGSRIFDITVSSLIGLPADKREHRPASPKGFEKMEIVWISQNVQPIQANFIVDGKRIAPYECEQHEAFRSCEMLVRREDLIKRADIIFLRTGATPAIVKIYSVAAQAYGNIKEKYATKADFPVDPEDAQDLKDLHSVDPKIPEVIYPPH